MPYSASVCLTASAYASPLSVANTEMAAKWLDDEQIYALCTNHLAHKSNHATCLQPQLIARRGTYSLTRISEHILIRPYTEVYSLQLRIAGSTPGVETAPVYANYDVSAPYFMQVI